MPIRATARTRNVAKAVFIIIPPSRIGLRFISKVPALDIRLLSLCMDERRPACVGDLYCLSRSPCPRFSPLPRSSPLPLSSSLPLSFPLNLTSFGQRSLGSSLQG